MFLPQEQREALPSRENDSKTLKPSAAIRLGHPQIQECQDFRFCAIGAMWRGYGRSEEEMFPVFNKSVDAGKASNADFAAALAVEMGLPAHIGMAVSELHEKGTPRLEIAAWLEAQGL